LFRFRYQHLDQQAFRIQDAKIGNPNQTFEESLDVKLKGFGDGDSLSWIYALDIKDVWEEFVRGQQPE
jgi:salicylate hydroxylase